MRHQAILEAESETESQDKYVLVSDWEEFQLL